MVLFVSPNSAFRTLIPSISIQQILAHCILVVLAVYFPDDLTPEFHLAFEKFLANVALAMSDKYR